MSEISNKAGLGSEGITLTTEIPTSHSPLMVLGGLGIVFSKIFGHAQIILPALLKKPINYHASLYLPLILLHLYLILRIIGDTAIIPSVRMWGGILNELAVVLFFLVILTIVKFANKHAIKNSQPIGIT